MNEKNINLLKNIFSVVLDIDDFEQIPTIRRISESKWDSLANVTLIGAIENEFNVLLNIDEINSMTSYRAIELMLGAKITDG